MHSAGVDVCAAPRRAAGAARRGAAAAAWDNGTLASRLGFCTKVGLRAQRRAPALIKVDSATKTHVKSLLAEPCCVWRRG